MSNRAVRVAVIDNYDSFTYNLAQAFGVLLAGTGDMRIWRNDRCDVDDIVAARPTHLVISPGPCTPRESGISLAAIQRFRGEIPILGVCLGHQCIGQVFGATVERADRVVHGKTSAIWHDGRGVFAGMPQGFAATRYHSLVVKRETVPKELEISAWTDRDEVMGLRHLRERIEGVQFHPESFLTIEGPRLLANFLSPGHHRA